MRNPFSLSESLRQTAIDLGIDVRSVTVAKPPTYFKIGWEDLCTERTKSENVTASPIIIIEKVIDNPEAPQLYDTYIGTVRCEFATEYGERFYITHARCYSDTGEYLPLSEWLKSISPPVVCRFGYISTNNPGRHVVRPLPADIPIA